MPFSSSLSGVFMQDRSLDEMLLPLEAAQRPVSIAARLWTTLEGNHCAINSIARTNQSTCVSEVQMEVLNGLFHQIIRLLGQDDHAKNLRLLEKDRCYTFVDALIIVGHYKGALRSYRVNVLGESQYTF